MKTKIFFAAISNTSLILTLTATASGLAQSTPATPPATTTTTTSQTQPPAPPAPPKVVSYYGFSYRAFTGVANPGPVNLIDGDMHMHVLSLKYNLSEKWAVRVGSAYLIHTLNIDSKIPNTPPRQVVNVEGFGDLRTAALYTAFKEKAQSLDFVFGLSMPTSPILKDDVSGKPLPPQDQFSSGTYDPMIAVNYSRSFKDLTLAQKIDWVFHTGENSAGYRLGDDFGATTAVSYAVKPWFVPVLSARFTDRKDLAVNNFHKPQKANVKYGSGWEGVLALRSGMPLKADQSLRLGFEAGAPIFKTSNTAQYIVGETLWYVGTNLTATY